MNNKTYLPKVDEISNNRQWHHLDANGRVLGRIACEAANILRGKNKRWYTSHLDCGDFVIITNADKIVLTGKKLEQKIDYRHSGYSGGDVYTPYSKLMAEKPERAVLLAVKGMLAKNKLGNQQIKRLKVYRGTAHPHSAQFAQK